MKVIIYQAFVRLFGNISTDNIPYGTKEENGVGKFPTLPMLPYKG